MPDSLETTKQVLIELVTEAEKDIGKKVACAFRELLTASNTKDELRLGTLAVENEIRKEVKKQKRTQFVELMLKYANVMILKFLTK